MMKLKDREIEIQSFIDLINEIDKDNYSIDMAQIQQAVSEGNTLVDIRKELINAGYELIDYKVKNLESKLAENNKEKDNLMNQINELNSKIEDLNKNIEDQNNEINRVLGLKKSLNYKSGNLK